ncbi:MAG: FAD-dependent oxidoreductase [Acidobacteriota bacterium]|nr:FAD-dependent oxidoreductase [Acidobacteriota bacterium]
MQAKLISALEIAPGVRRFVFEAPEVQRLDFVPGQFVSLTETIAGRAITRAYSIASAPAGGNRFELCLNLVDGGVFTPHLFELSPGDTVDMLPPLGTFTLRQPLRDSLLVATGTGVAPFRSMLQAELRPGSPGFTLLFGVRHESHLLYRQEFEEMARDYSQFRFWPTLTQPARGWGGRTGRVQAHLAEALEGRTDVDVYLCGLRPMVDDVRQILKSMGFDRKQIRYEKYD